MYVPNWAPKVKNLRVENEVFQFGTMESWS